MILLKRVVCWVLGHDAPEAWLHLTKYLAGHSYCRRCNKPLNKTK